MQKFVYKSVSGRGGFLYLVSIVFIFSVLLGKSTAANSTQQNLVDLVTQSERILMGTVTEVTDGFSDKGVPFTQITLQVSECLKGDSVSTYSFRQFGLTSKTDTHSKYDFLGISPMGFLHWQNGETVLVFLHHPARLSGLQATVGLFQGKLNQVQGRFESSTGISNLFKNLVVEANDLSPDQIDMLRNTSTTVDASPLLALIRRAVNENWVGTGVMHDAH